MGAQPTSDRSSPTIGEQGTWVGPHRLPLETRSLTGPGILTPDPNDPRGGPRRSKSPGAGPSGHTRGMRLVVIGGGGHGREVLTIVRALQAAGTTDIDFLGFLDDGAPDTSLLGRLGVRHLGPVDRAADLDACAAIGIGSPHTRMAIDEKLRAADIACPVLIHPHASIGEDVGLGPGTVVTAGVRVTTNVATGRHSHLNLNCTVSHDVRIGDYVTISPGAAISGNVIIGDRVYVGTNAAVIQGLHLGSDCTVGAGAAVLRDVDAHTTVVGVPARALHSA